MNKSSRFFTVIAFLVGMAVFSQEAEAQPLFNQFVFQNTSVVSVGVGTSSTASNSPAIPTIAGTVSANGATPKYLILIFGSGVNSIVLENCMQLATAYQASQVEGRALSRPTPLRLIISAQYTVSGTTATMSAVTSCSLS